MCNYFDWLDSTCTRWWHDSAIIPEIDEALGWGAMGVTTNPLLLRRSLDSEPEMWRGALPKGGRFDIMDGDHAVPVMNTMLKRIAKRLYPVYLETGGREGYVCAQVHPGKSGEREELLAMARMFSSWAPNLAVKLPATSAAIDIMEWCVEQGITTVITAGFTVAQSLVVARRYQNVVDSMRAADPKAAPGRCFSVIMVGRLDDYLREVSRDNGVSMAEADLMQSGIAVTKKAYRLFQENRYEAKILASGFRSPEQVLELSGGDLHISLGREVQCALGKLRGYFENGAERPVDSGVIERLGAIREFGKAYNLDGLQQEDFIGYGATQKTLAQFEYQGWSGLSAFD